MSTSSSSSESKPGRPFWPARVGQRIHGFWQRVSEGCAIDELWGQFAADARATYHFYSREVDWDAIEKMSGGRRAIHIAKEFFWALLLKLSPARRVLLLIALVFMVVNSIHFTLGKTGEANLYLQFYAAALFFLLLVLELADRVTMKRDLEIAREIQNWLVPSTPPEVPDAEIAFAASPQNTVAGDYYDAFYPAADAASGGKLLLVIADVAGKSVPAALLMATFQASLRSLAGQGAPIGELVARINRYACAYSLEGRRFTTTVVAEYDPASRIVTYVNAGHNPPVVRRRTGDLEFLREGGLPLGIDASKLYQTASVSLAPGDVLVLYTDGVVEAFNEKGEEFGEDRWFGAIRALPEWNAKESLDSLMKSVKEFVGLTRQSDDITCLILRLS
jgi:sigma-B regulation protein RsbU (phosphoserine phosphatase)